MAGLKTKQNAGTTNFVPATTAPKKLNEEEVAELKKAFDVVDTDKNGTIEKEELRKMMQATDEDGKVTDAELQAFLD